MISINVLMEKISPAAIDRKFRSHNDARGCYRLSSSVVNSYSELIDVAADYYKHHYCYVNQTDISIEEAKESVSEIFNSSKEPSVSIDKFVNMGINGINGGMGRVLDQIANSLMSQAIYKYTLQCFDSQFYNHNIEERTELIRQFLKKYDNILPPHISREHPSYYARDYYKFIDEFCKIIKQCAAQIF